MNQKLVYRGVLALVCSVMIIMGFPAMAQEDPREGRDFEGCVPPQEIVIGQIVTLQGGVYIRALPDINSGIVSYTAFRMVARVLDGPICADGYNWWRVERTFSEPTFNGWVADGRPEKLFIFPNDYEDPNAVLPCPVPLPVPVNGAIRLFEGVRVREVPGLSGRVLTNAQIHTDALVLDGPICQDGYNWWQVTLDSAGVTYTGWIVEGTPSGSVIDTPVINAVPDAGPEFLPCVPPKRLREGDIAILRFYDGQLRHLRSTPSLRVGEVLFSLPSGIQMEVLSGPFCFEGINWRNVRVFGGSQPVEGWIAEDAGIGRFLGVEGEDYGRPAP